jgi:hypothetical protein
MSHEIHAAHRHDGGRSCARYRLTRTSASIDNRHEERRLALRSSTTCSISPNRAGMIHLERGVRPEEVPRGHRGLHGLPGDQEKPGVRVPCLLRCADLGKRGPGPPAPGACQPDRERDSLHGARRGDPHRPDGEAGRPDRHDRLRRSGHGIGSREGAQRSSSGSRRRMRAPRAGTGGRESAFRSPRSWSV